VSNFIFISIADSVLLPPMRFIAVPILILLILSQTFSQWFVLAAFKINQAYIAKNTCENRFRPQLNCNGNCVLMKKMKQREEEQQKEPVTLKLEISTIVLSSRTFFASVPATLTEVKKRYSLPDNSGAPVDRSFSFFHPPQIS
jgi:hypothetical protein